MPEQIFSSNGVHDRYPEPAGLADHRSEEVTEIIGRMPSWLIRRGISLTGIILLGILIAAWFFKFPDVIASKIVISSGNPPVKLVARSSLPIQQIFVANDEQVTSGETLCVLANSAVYGDIQKINTLVTQLDTSLDLAASLLNVKIPGALQLGDLQGGYTDLCVAIQAYLFFIRHNTYQATIGHLAKQVTYNGQLQKELSTKEKMLQEQLSLQHNRFTADSSLVTDRVISPLEYEESKKKMLDQQMSMGNNKSSIIQNNLQQIGYQKDIAQLTLQKQSEENNLQEKVKDAVRRLKGQYAQWEQAYVISSPTNGKVTFFKFWKENQYVTAGEGIMMVTPPIQAYIVHGTVGLDNTGKIKVGQRVIMKLPAYPFEEYGVLNGHVAGRSVVAMDGNFSLEIKLDNDLTTNTGKTIPPQPEVEALGEILTENKSILQRLFERIIGSMNDRR
ncbi:MAG: HlyD family efflux transporter periplasmic adaptor subunit [Bacteroidetes bacterium]|nr:HlyD family efflux transporter periplasmic adaptor subunit [Bacteroidota bacterium]